MDGSHKQVISPCFVDDDYPSCSHEHRAIAREGESTEMGFNDGQPFIEMKTRRVIRLSLANDLQHEATWLSCF